MLRPSRPPLGPPPRALCRLRRLFRAAALATGFALLWGGSPTALAQGAAVGGAPAAVLQVKGSDTIGGSLGPRLATAYRADHPDIEVRWEALGSGTAFVGLFDGSAQLGASSRSVKEGELAEARRLGIELKEYVLGYDGIAVLVHPSNPVGPLSLEQVAALFTGRIDNWKSLGGPDLPVRRISRPSYSGTHSFFKDLVLRGGRKDGTEEFAPDTTWVEHSEDIVDRLRGEPGGVSYLGMGWVKEGVRPVPISTGDDDQGVLPRVDAIRAGRYPIYRPLLLYSRGEPSGEVRRFLAYLLAGEGRKLVAAEGFISSDAPSNVSRQAAAAVETAGGESWRVRFAFGGTRLDGAARAVVGQVAERLRRGGRVVVVGHADSIGSPRANRAVSRRRAQAVARALRAAGLSATRITVESRGSEQPVATNETVDGRRLNRRVDLIVLSSL